MNLNISAKKKWPISPYLAMQFMEPLGSTDSSVDAGWDYLRERWHDDLLDTVRSLGPGMVRWGGCFASYYHWYEGVGPMDERKPMLNLCWDGLYSNHVGTKEFVGFCRAVGAEPLFVFNMESDGRMRWAYPREGENRFGTAEEAAAWVRYCNDPDDALRNRHDPSGPYNVRWWQIGNETSYDRNGYSLKQAADATRRFAKAALEADPSVNLIAWGDSGWAPAMCEAVGEYVSHIAFHEHYGSALPDSPLNDTEYRRDPARTWEHLMSVPAVLDKKIREMREQVEPFGKRLAMTEGHFALRGRNRCDVLSSWIAGVAYARNFNVIFRHSDVLDIATMADFFGNRWQVNAILIPTPHGSGRPYFQPVGQVMRLFGRFAGDWYAEVRTDGDADVTAGIRGDTVFLRVVNPQLDAPLPLTVMRDDGTIPDRMVIHEIAPDDPTTEVTPQNAHCFDPVERTIAGNAYTLPPAAVAVLEIPPAEAGEAAPPS
ncbi:MAG: alpha-L-arabinofuranosidase [Clostridia bacterium]|nr:alpha-L-arabinofuranosidase [Clostridia bacterium]